jgi:hypothetical protein
MSCAGTSTELGRFKRWAVPKIGRSGHALLIWLKK